jgi:hypothetical protein
MTCREDQELAELNRLQLRFVAGHPEDKKEIIAVHLELRTLMRIDSVVHCELVEVELSADRVDLVLCRW